MQLLEIYLQEEFTFFCDFVWVRLEKEICFPQQLVTFLVLDGAKAVVMKGDIAVDPLGVCYVEKM
jgi:hypothetical protein